MAVEKKNLYHTLLVISYYSTVPIYIYKYAYIIFDDAESS